MILILLHADTIVHNSDVMIYYKHTLDDVEM